MHRRGIFNPLIKNEKILTTSVARYIKKYYDFLFELTTSSYKRQQNCLKFLIRSISSVSLSFRNRMRCWAKLCSSIVSRPSHGNLEGSALSCYAIFKSFRQRILQSHLYLKRWLVGQNLRIDFIKMIMSSKQLFVWQQFSRIIVKMESIGRTRALIGWKKTNERVSLERNVQTVHEFLLSAEDRVWSFVASLSDRWKGERPWAILENLLFL